MNRSIRWTIFITVAFTLAWAATTTPATGHPMGAVVSTGSNPIVNAAGRLTDPGFVSIVTAPADQDVVITDLVFSADHSGAGEPELRLASTGTVVGRYFIFGGSYHGGGPAHFALQTGIKIPAGDSLELNIHTTNDVNYAISGYYAQP
jgi:hypothetical protein